MRCYSWPLVVSSGPTDDEQITKLLILIDEYRTETGSFFNEELLVTVIEGPLKTGKEKK